MFFSSSDCSMTSSRENALGATDAEDCLQEASSASRAGPGYSPHDPSSGGHKGGRSHLSAYYKISTAYPSCAFLADAVDYECTYMLCVQANGERRAGVAMPSAWEGSMAEAKTKTISSTEFQRNIGSVIDQVRNGKSAVIVAAHGRPQVAILPVDEYDALMEARRQLAWTRLARLTSESVVPPTDQVLEASTGDD